MSTMIVSVSEKVMPPAASLFLVASTNSTVP